MRVCVRVYLRNQLCCFRRPINRATPPAVEDREPAGPQGAPRKRTGAYLILSARKALLLGPLGDAVPAGARRGGGGVSDAKAPPKRSGFENVKWVRSSAGPSSAPASRSVSFIGRVLICWLVLVLGVGRLAFWILPFFLFDTVKVTTKTLLTFLVHRVR